MKLKTIRVRRSRPSAPALALALALTMLCVYLLSLYSVPEDASGAASAAALGEAELRMEGLSAAFVCDARCGDLTEARVQAANCAASGGAGLLLSDGGKFAVVREAVGTDTAPEGALARSAPGLTLRLSGPAPELAAISDAVGLLRAQAAETGDLAASLEDGGTDAGSLASLLEVYRTQAARALEALEALPGENPVVSRLRDATRAELARLSESATAPTPSNLRLLHATACCQWLDLLDELAEEA